jgi:hypothetical protein
MTVRIIVMSRECNDNSDEKNYELKDLFSPV